jgi:hypothetical protein
MTARTLLALVLLAGGLQAQSRFDWVISNLGSGFPSLYGESLLIFSHQTRALLRRIPLPVTTNDVGGVVMDPINDGAWIVTVDDDVLRVTTSGVITTIAANLGSPIHGIDTDEDGSFVVVRQGGIMNRVSITGVVGTITTGLGANVNAVKWDLDTGNYVAGNAGATPILWRVSRAGVITTLTNSIPGIGIVGGIDQDPRTGDFLVCGTSTVARVTPAGVATAAVVSPAELNGANHLALLPTGHPDGEYNVAVADFGGAPTGLYTYDLTTGRLVSTILNYPGGAANGIGPSGVLVHQGRALHGEGNGRGGTNYRLGLRNPVSEAGKTYVISGSFGARPGFQLPDGRQINLALDDLYFLTTQNLLPTIFQNFVGALLPNGDRDAFVFVLPDPVIIGLRTFYSFAIVDAAAPNGIGFVSNTHAFTVRP